MSYTTKYSDFTIVLNDLDGRGKKKRVPVHRFMLSRFSFFEDCMEMCEGTELELDCNENVMNWILKEIYNDVEHNVTYHSNFIDDCDIVIMCHRYLNLIVYRFVRSIERGVRNLNPGDYPGVIIADKIMAVYHITKTSPGGSLYFSYALPEFIASELTFGELKNINQYHSCYFNHKRLRNNLPRPDPTNFEVDYINDRYNDMVEIYGGKYIDMMINNTTLQIHLYQNNLLITCGELRSEFILGFEENNFVFHINMSPTVPVIVGNKIYITYFGNNFIGKIMSEIEAGKYIVDLFISHTLSDTIKNHMAKFPNTTLGSFFTIYHETTISPIPNPYGDVGDE